MAHLALAQSYPLDPADRRHLRLSERTRMLDQAQVYALFGALDRIPGIMEPRVGRWRAWPMAKMHLVWRFLHAPSAGASGKDAGFWLRKVGGKLPRYAGAVPLIWRRPKVIPSAPAIGMLHVPRLHRLHDGRERDFIFGELLTGAGLARPVVALRHDLLATRAPARPDNASIDLAPYHAGAEQLALLFMADPRLVRAAAALNRHLENAGVPLEPSARKRNILLALALFEARRRIFRQLFSRLRLCALVATYAPGRYAEIAAARELGLGVVELQHGVIGSRCPDYAWPSELRRCKPEMPLPDRMAVFGPAFRKLVLSSGFWSSEEVVPTGAAALEAHRSSARQRDRKSGPLRLLFMTQAPARSAALAFWRELGARNAFIERGYCVAFKVHPEEADQIEAYRALVRSAPDRFSLLAADVNPVDAMLDADVVVSYNSMSLIEALALGRAAISICGPPIPRGFAGSFGLRDIVAFMAHVDSPDALLDVLGARAADADKLAHWHCEAEHAGRDYFSDGFTSHATALINQVVASAAAPEPLLQAS
jgi:hypothetical protein